MSYTVDFWEYPIPNTFAEAYATWETVRDAAPSTQNPKFLELAARLTQHFPCSMDLYADTEIEVWSEGPVDGKTRDAWWGVGILTQHAETVLPVIVREANTLGLTVFDPQLGKAYVPDGVVLVHGKAIGD